MKAVQLLGYGGTENLRYGEVPDPEPGPGQVLVRVRACALNHLDLWIRRGMPRVRLPHIPGSDVAGEVAALGAGVSGPPPGSRVLVQPGLSCGTCRACLAGHDNLCPAYGILGQIAPGGCAELVTVPAANVVPIPAGLGFEEAAAIPLVFLTAWHMLVCRAALRPGELLLVVGAGSGVGSAAIQIGKLLGSRVIATAGSEHKLARARELGADDTIEHSRQDIAAEVGRLTRGRGVDVVFEHVGAAVWDSCLASLARGGRLVTCGATTGGRVGLSIPHLFGREQTVLGSFMGSKADLLAALGFLAQGKLRPVVDRTYPLAEIRAAHERLETRAQFGKVVLLP